MPTGLPFMVGGFELWLECVITEAECYLLRFHLNASQAAQLYVLVQMTLSIAIELVEAADPCLELSRAFIGAYILSSRFALSVIIWNCINGKSSH